MYARRGLAKVPGMKKGSRDLAYVIELQDLEFAIWESLKRIRKRDGEKIYRDAVNHLRETIERRRGRVSHRGRHPPEHAKNGENRTIYLGAFGPAIRPLPPHFVHGGGYILRPGFVTSANPVPLHASHFRSDGGEDIFLIRLPQMKPCLSMPQILEFLLTEASRKNTDSPVGELVVRSQIQLAGPMGLC
jgi:hypothetical protein